jgi:cytidylate kinase
VSRLAAARLRFLYADTGALYRAIGFTALQSCVEPADETGVAALLPDLTVELRFDECGQRVLVNGADMTDNIRAPQVSMAASAVSALPSVRAFLLDLQRDLAKNHNVIMDGRDIGTVVLPNAEVKVFLTAASGERARRRYNELLSKGENVTYDDVYREMQERDKNDSARAISPLKPAPDAVFLDTTALALDEVLERLLNIIKLRIEN